MVILMFPSLLLSKSTFVLRSQSQYYFSINDKLRKYDEVHQNESFFFGLFHAFPGDVMGLQGVVMITEMCPTLFRWNTRVDVDTSLSPEVMQQFSEQGNSFTLRVSYFVSLVSLLPCFTRTCRFIAWGAVLCQQMDQITSYQTLHLHSHQFRLRKRILCLCMAETIP